uniref:Molybdate-anion transporter n=1 Tax=Corethron hystrix TaxID=216773 RepID=A0A7S1BRI0_9STRA|mmetsp:Transcript_38461/g.89417  ORF Transcript_38461/g.89417 Transcript_38461/m.89417 type:complete len:592 (+) Transcript_38461:347-2122(+)|eukprot:CAMPEP_0113299528 /NCGR_PEP_ID=MMETSP0010_2-20120614/1529_1 /TAXON_ID=216773 ORGANISM="Corethron hystrix, Strain 308" /NCGR_SAMPLE_ID=MMETSP0010_2 /ASSEMBLY_ACC=CAM_ASM_000155 /LENGTH=591 /DNA_ID=CAMNT_0000152785 /DNA_START=188 /DNA_END=1963 /DNA_ORIENTATION=- /assembly_acc=CAM_ASM_000155
MANSSVVESDASHHHVGYHSSRTCSELSKQEVSDDVTDVTVPMSEISFISDSARSDGYNPQDQKVKKESFTAFRVNYLIVYIAIMLADGLQGTHLYVLYDGYNFNVATLYATGFAAGGLASPFMGPLVDRIGRRTSAIVYCILEMIINVLEQNQILAGLFVARIVGGITTNLLFTVFESWLVTEHRKKGFAEDKLEIILRDSVISSNISAIASGFIAHQLANYLGAVGPFEGAVGFTFVALILVATQWAENYGSESTEIKSISSYMREAFVTIKKDSKIARIGIIQGLAEGCLFTFVFLWSPILTQFASLIRDKDDFVFGLDSNNEPAYGLIFGGFMACGAIGGFLEPRLRKLIQHFLDHFTPVNERLSCQSLSSSDSTELTEGNSSVGSGDDNDCETNKLTVQLLASFCYFLAAIFISVPYYVQNMESSFILTLGSFLMYEFLIGVYMPCEGVIRSIYMPNDAICSMMNMLRVVVNFAVAIFVISTNIISVDKVFALLSAALFSISALQLSLLDHDQLRILKSAAKRLFSFTSVSCDSCDLGEIKKNDDLFEEHAKPISTGTSKSNRSTMENEGLRRRVNNSSSVPTNIR